jgi:hypothetical protein
LRSSRLALVSENHRDKHERLEAFTQNDYERLEQGRTLLKNGLLRAVLNRGKQYRQIENDCQFRIGTRKRGKYIADLHRVVSRTGTRELFEKVSFRRGTRESTSVPFRP